MTHDEPTVACTLCPEAVQERVEEWRSLVEESDGVAEIDGGARLRFSRGDVSAARVAALAEAERDCCPFFVFTLRVDESGCSLDVAAPAEAALLVGARLGVEVAGAT